MNTQIKLIKSKVGLLSLAEQLGNVSQACKLLVIPETVFIGLKSFMMKVVRWRF